MDYIRNAIREAKENKIFSKGDLLNNKRIKISYNDGEFEFEIKNTLENIAQFIMFSAIFAEKNGDNYYSVQFYATPKNEDYLNIFMNTMGYLIDLCADVEYLEELKKILIPLQQEYESCICNGTAFPEYKVIMYESEASDNERVLSSFDLDVFFKE